MPPAASTPTLDLSAAQARRVFLGAQSLARKRPRGAVRDAQFREYLARQGVLQLDTVNVLARAHYLPVFSRLGPYSTGDLDGYLWGSGHTFEHWGHEASVMPLDLLPAMHRRMAIPDTWKARTLARLERERPGLVADVLAAVTASGPVTARDLEHLAPSQEKRGPWWGATHVKTALEYLFHTGAVAASRNGTFGRTYDAAERAWGVPGAHDPLSSTGADAWALSPDDAVDRLVAVALPAMGIGTVADVADHFRLPIADTARALRDLAEAGGATVVSVDGWQAPAYLAAGAEDPGSATGVALLSPFDPACWFRPRLERMFGMHYRIEIYTPEPKRVYGYYTLPLLMGDQMVGRFDLKADRKAGVLRVRSSWREDRPAPGARRRSDAEIAGAAAGELTLMARWLGLERIDVEPVGNIATQITKRMAGEVSSA